CRGRRRPFEHLAARFAAKEAVLKAFGTGLTRRLRWTEIEILNERSGRPRVVLDGSVAEFARRHGLLDLDVSLTHSEGLAVAQGVTVWARRRRYPGRRSLLSDRTAAYEPRESVTARKVTSYSEEYWEQGSDGELRMPPPFALEAFCQAGTWLIMISTE